MLDIFDNKAIGILTLIEDECKKAKPNSRDLIAQFRTKREENPNPRLLFPINAKDDFVVCHFSNNVQYNMVWFNTEFYYLYF